MLEKLNLGEAFKDREEGNSSEKQGKIIPSEKSYPDIKPKNNCVGKRERRDKEERKDMLFCAVLSHSVVSDSLRPPDCSPLGSSVHGIHPPAPSHFLETPAAPVPLGLFGTDIDSPFVSCFHHRANV